LLISGVIRGRYFGSHWRAIHTKSCGIIGGFNGVSYTTLQHTHTLKTIGGVRGAENTAPSGKLRLCVFSYRAQNLHRERKMNSGANISIHPACGCRAYNDFPTTPDGKSGVTLQNPLILDIIRVPFTTTIEILRGAMASPKYKLIYCIATKLPVRPTPPPVIIYYNDAHTYALLFNSGDNEVSRTLSALPAALNLHFSCSNKPDCDHLRSRPQLRNEIVQKFKKNTIHCNTIVRLFWQRIIFLGTLAI